MNKTNSHVKKAKLEFYLKHGRKASVAIMGLAFKPDIDDLRESPAKHIAQKILQDSIGDNFYIVEPNIPNHKEFELTPFNEACDKSDIIVFLVAHKEFKDFKIDDSKIVFNFCGIPTLNS